MRFSWGTPHDLYAAGSGQHVPPVGCPVGGLSVASFLCDHGRGIVKLRSSRPAWTDRAPHAYRDRGLTQESFSRQVQSDLSQ